jgi:hypothetical protein
MIRILFVMFVAVVLAAGSFGYARHHYVEKNSVTLTKNTTLENPFMDDKLFGDWMKDEIVFAVIVPVALLVGGFVLAVKK